MKNVNFDVDLLNTDGTVFKDNDGKNVILKQSVANMIMLSKAKDDPARMYDLAITVRNSEGAIDLEDSDYNSILAMVKEGGLTNAVAGQIIKAMDKSTNK